MIKITSSLEELAIEGQRIKRLSDNFDVKAIPVDPPKMFQSPSGKDYDFDLILIDKHVPEGANGYVISKDEPLVDEDIGFNYAGGEDHSSVLVVQYYQILD